jgi:hypothetical protein
MIEFVVKDRRMRYYPDDDIITMRAVKNGKETQHNKWKPIKFSSNGKGYMKCNISMEGKNKNLYKERLIYLAKNPGWNIFGGRMEYSAVEGSEN